jgi:hypothetical protein
MAQARLAACVALLTLIAGCGTKNTPTSPAITLITAASTPAAGPSVWTGVIDITTCQGGESDCVGGPQKFVLRLAADNNSGVLQIDTDGNEPSPSSAVNVTATTAGTSIQMTGTRAFGISPSLRTIDVTMALKQKGDPSEATLTYVITTGASTVRKTGRVLFTGHDVTLFGQRFDGEWQGLATRTQCTGDCARFDPVLRNGDVSLRISQAGATVVGLLNTNAFSGTVLGSDVTGTGHYQIAGACHRGFDDGSICLVELSFSVTVDAFDQLHGTINYRVSGADDRDRLYDFTAVATLDGITRWPG